MFELKANNYLGLQKDVTTYFASNEVLTAYFTPTGRLYRGRLFDSDQRIVNASEVSYIPNPAWVAGYGRANYKGQSIFYCADSYDTIFYESMLIRDGKPPSPREKMIFGEWVCSEPLKLVVIIQPVKEKRVGFYEEHYGQFYDVACKDNPTIRDTMTKLYRVFATRAQTNSDYIVPAYISNYFYENYDGVLYPSTPFSNGGYNIALKPKLVKEGKLKINKIIEHIYSWTIENKQLMDEGDFIEAKSIDDVIGNIYW